MTMRLGRSRSPMRSGVKRGWTDMTALRTRDQAVTTILPICSPASMKRWASAIRRRQGLGEHAGHQQARHSGGEDGGPDPGDPAREEKRPTETGLLGNPFPNKTPSVFPAREAGTTACQKRFNPARE